MPILIAATGLPVTPVGRALADFLGQLAPFLVVVPLLIVATEYQRLRDANLRADDPLRAACPNCVAATHDVDARFCTRCGAPLSAPAEERATPA